MSEESSEHGEVYNHYLELSKPTKEDFERVFTEDELKELCLKNKCSVDIFRWNVVNDYRILFTESGRFQRWSDRDRLKMLAKAVNKMKPSVLYTDEEIQKTRREEWGMQLKDNILSLNFWRRKRDKNTALVDMDSAEINSEEIVINTQSMNIFEPGTSRLQLMAQSQSQQIEIENEIHIESLTEDDPQAKAIKDKELEPGISTQGKGESGVLAGHLCFEEDSDNSVDTVLLHNGKQMPETETLHSDEVPPKINNYYDVNTQSMTISSHDLPNQPSEDVISNYDDFINTVPLTSTQSQNQRSEEIILP